MRSVVASITVALGLLLALPDCMTTTPPSGSCPTGSLECGSSCCPDETHYACVAGACRLTSCNEGMQLCGSGCIPVTAVCCSQTSGLYCPTGETCCDNGCIPVGGACCSGTGKYCPVGRVCCGNGTQCC